MRVAADDDSNVSRRRVTIDLVQIVQEENMNSARPHHLTLAKLTRPFARIVVTRDCDDPGNCL
jgi:hypothetical protein